MEGRLVFKCWQVAWTLAEVERVADPQKRSPSPLGGIFAAVSISLPFSLPVSSLESTILPYRDSPRRVPTPNQRLLGLHKRRGWLRYLRPRSRGAILPLSPGLSRLGQYRKRLTCTLTRIHGAICSPPSRRDGDRAITCDTNRLFIETQS